MSFISLINQGTFSYQLWAMELSSLISGTVSKQALFKRLTPALVSYLKSLLELSIQRGLNNTSTKNKALFKNFKNVYLHDATHFRLAEKLSSSFKGNFTAGKDRASAKIQAVYNLSKGVFSYLELTHFTNPDISCVQITNSFLNARDLIIRDLGYFSLQGFEQLIKRKVYFLSRYKHCVNLNDLRTGNRMDLFRILKRKNCLDQEVILGAKCPVKVRLVIQRIDEKAANERRRKAKKDKRNVKVNHSKQYYYLLGFSIYVTNVSQDIWTSDQVAKAYRSRWYIETIFKSWKSRLKVHYHIHDRYATELTVKIHFYISLIYINSIVMPLLLMVKELQTKNNEHRQISLQKLSSFITLKTWKVYHDKDLEDWLLKASYYSLYEKRRRNNIIETYFEKLS